MSTPLILHGHFYQPPRENPWTGTVEREPSASPDHDWNQRIQRECYRANAFARVLDSYGRVENIVNNYALMSFNFGPTLLSWMAEQDPGAYHRILEGDRRSVRNNRGHGNALAQGYNHAILPLCNERDRRTQIRWGLADFRHRFGRSAEALWLPETACNDATLGALIDEGLRFAILSPHQAESIRRLGHHEWRSVADGSIDPSEAYHYAHRDGSGRSIVLFFYDPQLARAIAFEGALASSQTLLGAIRRARGGRLVHTATDGESYGHHTHFGDRTLAYALAVEARRGYRVTNYGAWLDENPPLYEVAIKSGAMGEGTAWSCAHGLGRWLRDCGCSTGAAYGWNQSWRGPLRQALDLLRDHAAHSFESLAGEIFDDPWSVRDDYIELVLDPERSREAFLGSRARRPLDDAARVRALSALELQRKTLLMYTSCGWFFADISGIETVQILKYAGHALDLLDELGADSPRERFLEALAEARSNIAEMGNGADVYRRLVEPCRTQAARAAAHLGIASLVETSPGTGELARFRFQRSNFERQRHGRLSMACLRLRLEDRDTTRSLDYALATMHFGGVDFYCVLKPWPGPDRFRFATAELWAAFRTASLPQLLRIARDHFGPEEYGLENLLAEGRQVVASLVFGELLQQFSETYAQLYESSQRTLALVQQAGLELPPEIRAAAELTLGRRFAQEIERARMSRNPRDYERAIEIAGQVVRHGYQIDREAASRQFSSMIAEAALEAVELAGSERGKEPIQLVHLAHKLGLAVDLGPAQEAIFPALERAATSPVLPAIALALGIAPTALPDSAAAEGTAS